jgi:hypothetical protein
MQVMVISLHTPTRLLATLQRLFPDATVSVQRGVDLRKVSVDHLHRAGLVSHGAVHALRHGRKWHHELSSRGAVGLAHANRLALSDRTDLPLLLLEDDATITDEGAFVRDVRALLAHQDTFDMASLATHVQDSNETEPAHHLPEGWYHMRGMFHLTHAVMYTPHGRRVVGEFLRDHPLEMQIDSLYGSLAQQGVLRVVVRHQSDAHVVQSIHTSSIQEMFGKCLLCDLSPNSLGLPLMTTMCLVVLSLLVCGCTAHMVYLRRV